MPSFLLRVLVTEFFIRGRVENSITQLSVAFIVGGAIIAGWETLMEVRLWMGWW